jgi:hypothetical protein
MASPDLEAALRWGDVMLKGVQCFFFLVPLDLPRLL